MWSLRFLAPAHTTVLSLMSHHGSQMAVHVHTGWGTPAICPCSAGWSPSRKPFGCGSPCISGAVTLQETEAEGGFPVLSKEWGVEFLPNADSYIQPKVPSTLPQALAGFPIGSQEA